MGCLASPCPHSLSCSSVHGRISPTHSGVVYINSLGRMESAELDNI